MKLVTKIKLFKALRDAEKKIGMRIPDSVAKDVLEHCKRKIACIKKDEDYLPVLYRTELPMQLAGRAINEQYRKTRNLKRKEDANVSDLWSNALSSSLP